MPVLKGKYLFRRSGTPARQKDGQEWPSYIQESQTVPLPPCEQRRRRKRIIRYSDNPILSSILDLLFDRTQVIARRVVILPGRIHDALKMHGEMLRAMKRRDPETAERSRREILSSARDMLGKYQRFIL